MKACEVGATVIAEGKALGVLATGSYAAAAASWEALVRQGVNIRPRALTTTILMRVFVADVFVHGIGGAKYDEVTDRIIRAFYGVEPAPYATISASLMLDWPFEPADHGDLRILERRMRDIRYNPQYFVGQRTDETARIHELLEEKDELVDARPADREQRRRKFERIRQINAELGEYLERLRGPHARGPCQGAGEACGGRGAFRAGIQRFPRGRASGGAVLRGGPCRPWRYTLPHRTRTPRTMKSAPAPLLTTSGLT